MLDERIDRRTLFKLGGAVALSGGLASRLAAAGTDAALAGTLASTTLRVGVASDPQTLDPERGQAMRANETIKNLYGEWVRYESDPTPHGYTRANVTAPMLGDALESMTLTNGGRTAVCKVRRGVTLPGGDPLNADVFIYKVERALGENFGSVFAFHTMGITDVSQLEKVNDYEFLMHLPHPTPLLGPLLRNQGPAIVDPTVVKQHATPSDPWAVQWVSLHSAATGPYLIDSYTPGTSLILKANPGYWGPKPFFQSIVLSVVPQDSDRVLLLKNGSIDIAADLSTASKSSLANTPGITLLSIPSQNTQDLLGFVLNKPPFNNRAARQAIAYAIPYSELAHTVLSGHALTPKGVWPQNSAWFKKNVPWPYTYSPAKARAVLAQAGMKGGFDFTVEISQTDADTQALVVPIQTALKDVGISMSINSTSPAQFQADLGKRSMQAWIQSNEGSYVDHPYYQINLWFATTGALNWFEYSNAGIDKVNQELSQYTSPSIVNRLAYLVQKHLNYDLPCLSLAEPNFLLPMRSDITGFDYQPDGLTEYRFLKRGK